MLTFVLCAGDTKLRAIDASFLYNHRHSSLSDWSPFEMTMGFIGGQDDTGDAKLFPLRDDIELTAGYFHKPRLNRARKPVIVIPQQLKEHPKRPSSDAPSDMKEQYAAWALGNFYSDRLMHELDPRVHDRQVTNSRKYCYYS